MIGGLRCDVLVGSPELGLQPQQSCCSGQSRLYGCQLMLRTYTSAAQVADLGEVGLLQSCAKSQACRSQVPPTRQGRHCLKMTAREGDQTQRGEECQRHHCEQLRLLPPAQSTQQAHTDDARAAPAVTNIHA